MKSHKSLAILDTKPLCLREFVLHIVNIFCNGPHVGVNPHHKALRISELLKQKCAKKWQQNFMAVNATRNLEC
jgi:hypothetical protein